MSARKLFGLFTLVSMTALAGCEKPRDPVAPPGASAGADQGNAGPEVVVETPGAEPTPPPEEPAPEQATPIDIRKDLVITHITVTKISCQADADCVKDSCCHATGCVARANAPSCGQTMCTMDCQAGTMDCHGGCSCQDGFCVAEVWGK